MRQRAVLLVAHGSADPRAAASTRALARAVAATDPGLDVRVSFLEHEGPRPGPVLSRFAAAGYRSAVVVPLLLTSAYHGNVDIPAVLAEARGLSVSVTDVLGPASPLLLAALRRRLPSVAFDGLVLVAAGTRDAAARSTVDEAATALDSSLGVPCVAGFASASSVTGAVAVSAVRARGCRRVAVASYFLAPGRLYDSAVASALSAGAVGPAAAPLGDAAELARLVVERVAACAGDARELLSAAA